MLYWEISWYGPEELLYTKFGLVWGVAGRIVSKFNVENCTTFSVHFFQGRRQELLEGVFFTFSLFFPSFSSPPFPYHSLSLPPLFLSSPFLPLLLEVGPLLKQLESLGVRERCKLPQRGPEWSRGRKRILCTLELSESHWWQSF